MGQLFVLALIVAACWCLCSNGGGKARTRTLHVHASGNVRKAARHEGGHAAVGQHVGGRVTKGWVSPDGSGAIYVQPPRRGWSPAEDIAISLAGGMAVGDGISHWSCQGDKSYIDSVLRDVPSQNRRAVMSEARRIARRGLSSQSGTARSVARQLEQRGQL